VSQNTVQTGIEQNGTRDKEGNSIAVIY
jgi:hypothetical protein